MRKKDFIYDKITLPFLVALHQVGNAVYGLDIENSGIYSFDMQSYEIQYKGRIHGADLGICQAFHSVVCHNDLAFFIPFRDKDLIIYDRERNKWEKVELELMQEMEAGEELRSREISGNLPGRFHGGFIFKDQLYLLPFGYRSMIKYHLTKGYVTHCYDFRTTVLKEDAVLPCLFEWMDATHIILICMYSNHVVIFDLEKEKAEIRTVGKEGYCFSAIKKYKDDYLLTVKNQLAFIRWQPDTDKQTEYKTFPIGCEIVNEKHCFAANGIHIYGDCLYCFPASCNMAIKFDLVNETMEEILPFSPYCQDKRLDRSFSIIDAGVMIDDTIYLYYQLGQMLTFNLKTEEVCAFDWKIKDIESIRRMEQDSFAGFIRLLGEKKEEKTDRSERSAGKMIYDAVSECIL